MGTDAWSHSVNRCTFCCARTGKGTRRFLLEPFELSLTSGTDIAVDVPIHHPQTWRACGRCAPLVADNDLWALASRAKLGERRIGVQSRCTTGEHADGLRQLLGHLSPAEA